MALVERLMALEEPWLPVHAFFAANYERIEGRLTRQQVIDMFAMNLAAIVEYDALAATAPTGTNALAMALKALFVEKIHAVFILAEGRYDGYNTIMAVRAKLGL